ncbi:2,3-diketo-5-methylthio-1-phosphopentane phosphatase [Colletotrichum gloeosporioides Cg-14]|uniref:2,3-diketo-5-methylthio-1-phosphopentane phosphatase n=1 Tax=Colletotrichum gloeosporioides (strain Cg-14) TaxID=1237896 RepID=T0LGP2_COLGC|nr:2,3-diketo-5-methylthio-1-phosphopentane phosphatase [Colletotrichum gloeosporioides Cg-14]
MGSQVTDTPALATNPKFIFFTDFDGTITLEDSNDYMTDNVGFGYEKRRDGNLAVLEGHKHFRDAFREMMESIPLPFDQCINLLKKNVKLDPVFKEFYFWAKEQNIPVVIISGGMRPIIRALLVQWLGEEEVDANIQIVSNQVAPREGKSINEPHGWQIVYHDDSTHGHDKSIELRKYSSLPDRPVMFYAGDGVSDLSAARETDLLFAKRGKDLVSWCEKENVSFVTFNDFSDILDTVKQIVDGKVSVKDAARGRIHH